MRSIRDAILIVLYHLCWKPLRTWHQARYHTAILATTALAAWAFLLIVMCHNAYPAEFTPTVTQAGFPQILSRKPLGPVRVVSDQDGGSMRRPYNTDAVPAPVYPSITVRPPQTEPLELTPDQARKLQDLLNTPQAGPGDLFVSWLVIKGPKLLLAFVIVITFVLLIRLLFRDLWDADIKNHPMPSAVVLSSIILFATVIGYAVLSSG